MSSGPFNEADYVGKVAKAAIAAPWECYAQAWGVSDKASNTPPNPLEAGVGAVNKMSDDYMQSQLDTALKTNIY